MMHLLAAKVKVCQLAGNQLLDLCYVDDQVTPRTTVFITSPQPGHGLKKGSTPGWTVVTS